MPFHRVTDSRVAGKPYTRFKRLEWLPRTRRTGRVLSICFAPDWKTEHGTGSRARLASIAFMQFDRGRPMVSVYTPEDGRTISMGPGAEPQFSPGGKWLAFSEPGGSGIVVRRLPEPGPRIQISNGPAAQARWSRDRGNSY